MSVFRIAPGDAKMSADTALIWTYLAHWGRDKLEAISQMTFSGLTSD